MFTNIFLKPLVDYVFLIDVNETLVLLNKELKVLVFSESIRYRSVGSHMLDTGIKLVNAPTIGISDRRDNKKLCFTESAKFLVVVLLTQYYFCA